MGDRKHRKWNDDDPKCPQGHLRTLCEIKTVNSRGQTKYECNIRRRARERLRSETKIRDRNHKRGALNLIAGLVIPHEITLTLVCGHTHIQNAPTFRVTDMMWCRNHQDWFEIHKLTKWGETREVTPLLSRHEIYGCTTKTGCTPRCKSEEAPPFDPAIISRNNMAVGHVGPAKTGTIRAKVIA